MNLIVKETVPAAAEAENLLRKRLSELNSSVVVVSFLDGNSDGYLIEIKNGNVAVTASCVSDFISASGKLLVHLIKNIGQSASLNDVRIEEIPVYKVRTHYMPAHFGNSFESAWPLEMGRYLEDAALFGANGYGDWFDPNDMPDPYNPRVFCSKSMFSWDKKKENFIKAKKLGMNTMLVITHNVAFTDQLRPEWEAIHSHKLRVQGQVLCPSIPEARMVCLDNHENLFKDLVFSGVEIDRLAVCPYDDGGCACGKCQPYYPTFLSMVQEILAIAQRYYPDIVLDIIGWWTSETEMSQLKEFIKELEPGVFGHFQFNPPYSKAHEIPSGLREFIGDMPLTTFVNIGYSDDIFDVYNKYGVHSAPHRLKTLISTFNKINCDGMNTYNEGFNDHLNVFLSSRLNINPSENLRNLLSDYCSWTMCLSGKTLETMTDILEEMQYPLYEKASIWLEKLIELEPRVKTPPRQQWIFNHILYKAKLMSLDYIIGSGDNWTSPADIKAVQHLIDERLEATEILWRDIYGLGSVAHVFVPERMYPKWYKKYSKTMGIGKSMIVPGSVISKNA